MCTFPDVSASGRCEDQLPLFYPCYAVPVCDRFQSQQALLETNLHETQLQLQQSLVLRGDQNHHTRAGSHSHGGGMDMQDFKHSEPAQPPRLRRLSSENPTNADSNLGESFLMDFDDYSMAWGHHSDAKYSSAGPPADFSSSAPSNTSSSSSSSSSSVTPSSVSNRVHRQGVVCECV